VEGFKKASFLKKILPDTFYGWRFFSKPAGPELAFLNTRNLVLQSFLSLFYFG